MLRRLRILIVVLGMTMNWTSTADAQSGDASDSSEYLIKAGFIYNFAKFVEWPSATFSQPDSPIVIGVLGTDPFGNVLDRIVEDKKIGPRGFVVKRYKWGKGPKGPERLQNPVRERVGKSAHRRNFAEREGFADPHGWGDARICRTRRRDPIHVRGQSSAL